MEASDQTHASESEGSDHVATRELRYLLAREIGERFQLIDKLTVMLFDTSLNHRWAEEGRKRNSYRLSPFLPRLSPPLFFLSLSLFSLPTTESLEQASLVYSKEDTLSI